MNVTPFYNRLIVKRHAKEKTNSGIHLPKSVQRGSIRPSQGEIVAIGPDAEIGSAEIGTKVLFGKHSGWDFVHNKEDYIVMNDEDLIGVVEVYFDE